MAALHYKSVSITNAEAAQQSLANPLSIGGSLREIIESHELTTSDEADSTVRYFRVYSGWRVSSLRIFSDLCSDVTTTDTGTIDVGLYDTTENGGAVVDADFFSSALSIKAAALNGVDITYESGTGVVDVPKYDLALWEQLGLTANPRKWYDVVVTVTEVVEVAGTVCLEMRYADGT